MTPTTGSDEASSTATASTAEGYGATLAAAKAAIQAARTRAALPPTES